MARVNDFQQTFDLFSKLTNENNYTLQDALKYCDERTTPQIAKEFNQQCVEFTQRAIGFIANELHNFIAEGRDIEQSLIEYQAKTPHYIFIEVLKALNLDPPATVCKADFQTLSKYIDCGFELFPCIQKREGDKIKYLPITLNGKIALYDTQEQKEKKERHGITDKALLQDLCTQRKYITDEYGRNQKIELFRIYPLDNNYIVIDIDTHEGKANGYIQWQNYCKAHGLDGVEYFNNLDLFPCYVESANGGKHLYFQFPYEIPEKIQDLDTSVEISTRDHGETAGGSFRAGTKNNFYTLHGKLEDAPLLPLCIYEDMQPPAKVTGQPFTPRNGFAGPQGNAPKWNQTLNGIVEKAREKHNDQPHDFAYWICKYCKMANDNNGTQYTKEEIANVLFALPEMATHDANDTNGVINSFNY